MSDELCKWESKYRADYNCDQPALPDDSGGCCILHLQDDSKDLRRFEQALQPRLDRRHLRILIGCYFPKSFDTISRYFEHVNVERLDCSEATFTRDMFFGKSTFTRGVNFKGTKFLGTVDFDGAAFLNEADFSCAEFSQEVKFAETNFQVSKANFKYAQFKGDVKFLGTWFKGEEVSFSHTEFEDGEVVFDNPHFRTQVYFIETIFRKSCTFIHAEFLGEDESIVFLKTDLSNCRFRYSSLNKVDFRHCTFNKKFLRQKVLRDELDADEKIKKNPNERTLREEEYEHARQRYVELKRSFENKKDWLTAGDFYYGEMECWRKTKGLIGRYLSLVAFYRLASGYGERPLRAGTWVLLLILGFALCYMPSADKVSSSTQQDKVVSTALTQIEEKEAKSSNQTQSKDLNNSVFPHKNRYRELLVWLKNYKVGLKTSLRVTVRQRTRERGWASTIQGIFGLILIALFILALRRKVKR